MTTDSALSGMVVLDLTQLMAGPYCTMVLSRLRRRNQSTETSGA